MANTLVARNGLYFSVSLQERMTLDEAAREVATALGVPLILSGERGTRGDYVGELIGLHLWLFVADPPAPGTAPRFALIGGPDHDLNVEAIWLDIGPYIAEFLAARTGRRWMPSGG